MYTKFRMCVYLDIGRKKDGSHVCMYEAWKLTIQKSRTRMQCQEQMTFDGQSFIKSIRILS